MKKAAIVLAALAILTSLVSCDPDQSGYGVQEPVSYQVCEWDSENSQVSFYQGTTDDYTVLKSRNTILRNGFYVVDSDTTIKSRITVNGNATLILYAATLNAQKGITVSPGSKLTITCPWNGSGTLLIDKCDDGFAGIGGDDTHGQTCGDIIFHGGDVTVTGGHNGAGIGGGEQSDGGTVVILGGNIIATGGDYGAGIGGGSFGNGGTVSIYGSPGYSVQATGSMGGAGIGGGNTGEGGAVSLYSTLIDLTATGSSMPLMAPGMGIGHGYGKNGYDGTLVVQPGIMLQVSDDNSSWNSYDGTPDQYMKTT